MIEDRVGEKRNNVPGGDCLIGHFEAQGKIRGGELRRQKVKYPPPHTIDRGGGPFLGGTKTVCLILKRSGDKEPHQGRRGDLQHRER